MPFTRRRVGTSVPRSQRRTTDGFTRSARAMSGTPTACIVRTAARYCGTVTIDGTAAIDSGAPRPPRAETADAPLDQRVRAREQPLVGRVALDHVGEIAEVV